MAYADASDVTARWGRTPTDEEIALINTRLEDVERMILRKIPKLDYQVCTGAICEDDVRQVESDAVLRLVRNPEGYLSETDGNYTYTLRQDISTGKLEILPEEWEILGVSRSRMFMIVPTLEIPT